MPEPELSLLFIRPLNRLGVPYLVSGSVAAILYGDHRMAASYPALEGTRDSATIEVHPAKQSLPSLL
jgi:hypothetical protein